MEGREKGKGGGRQEGKGVRDEDGGGGTGAKYSFFLVLGQ